MSGRITAPWSPDRVAALNAYQQLGYVHPFTCGNGCGVLTATTSGWFCPCGYVQGWAWDFMADPSDPFWQKPFGPPVNPPAAEACPGSGREVSGLLATFRCSDCGRSFLQAEGVYGAANGVRLNMWRLPEHEPGGEA